MQVEAHRLRGKTALVTGAARGIGRAIALRLGAEGARVAVADILTAEAQATASEITKAGTQALAVELDVTSLESARAAVERVEKELGPIDVLVNNAGWDKIEPFVESSPETWDKVIAINYRGVLNCCHAVARGMISRNQGKIVSIASDAARVGSTGEAVYSGCKGAIVAFSKTLARELARYRINVNVVCPGPTDTQLLQSVRENNPKIIDAMVRSVPFRRLGTPEDISGAVAFFASSDSDFVTGQVLSVSGGLTMVG